MFDIVAVTENPAEYCNSMDDGCKSLDDCNLPTYHIFFIK